MQLARLGGREWCIHVKATVAGSISAMATMKAMQYAIYSLQCDCSQSILKPRPIELSVINHDVFVNDRNSFFPI
jgi:hypothetical protein